MTVNPPIGSGDLLMGGVPIRGDFVVDPGDDFSAKWFAFRKKWPAAVLVWVVLYLIMALAMALVFMLRSFGKGAGLIDAPAFSTALIGLALGLLVLIVALVRNAASGRALARNRERLTCSFAIDGTGIMIRDALDVERRIPWSAMRRGAITRRLFLYRVKPDEWRYIPLRAFQPAEVETLRRKLATLAS